MRLTHIKLAGFKSFVDPTAIEVPSRLVGVVGPNGCGKSNIIDAVRWVLGETRASALRGDSMQDVIFNGSALRKPVARASVELAFDNSLGKAAGQWSQYAEIAVKRVLQRDGESLYYINNTQVRRRDVQDIFLGTGVGPRAYAIIEQGMISRVIEAKPEELRVFLEEAAGVSKYKERRRETEHRLDDTRENLARVDDIRAELETQIEKLTRQAEVARQYKSLQAEATHKQNLLWWLRKRDAENEAGRAQRDVERAANELESETARLREIERRVEQARVEHYAAGDAVNAAQGALYEVNTEASRLEAELRFVAETRHRLEAQLAHLALQIEQWERQRSELAEAAALWRQRRGEAADRIAAAEAQHAAEEALLPERDEAYRAAQVALEEARDSAARGEQALQVGQAHLAHADRVLEQLRAREERLIAEREQLIVPEPARLADLARDIAAAGTDADAAAARIRELQQDLPVLEAARAAALARLQEIEREANTREGRLATLKRIQEQVEEGGEINDWLSRHGLQGLPRLWQKMTVELGWETGVESVLRERLRALQLADPEHIARLLADPPPAKISVFTPSTASAPAAGGGALRPLASLVRYSDAAVRPLVEEWLAGCYAHEGVPSLTARLALASGAVLVNRDGHQFTRYGVSFHGPDSGDAGILARQREIEALDIELEGLVRAVGEARDVHAAAERALTLRREQITVLQEQEADRQAARHELRLEELRVNENIARVRERTGQIDAELAAIGQDRQSEAAARLTAAGEIGRHHAEIQTVLTQLDDARSAFDAAGEALTAQRNAIQAAARGVQEAMFAERECLGKISEIERSVNVLSEQLMQALTDRSATQNELTALRDEGLREELQACLAIRLDREQKLTAARAHLEEIGETLRSADEERLGAEQKLPPLRERIGELRLKEQAARLGVEQFAQQLAEAGADEAILTQAFEANKVRPGALQAEIQRLHQAMTNLGAINMAALEELGIATDRKAFLDAQSTDLREALDTLESAIRRIDRETREMLQQTFDEANRHFGELFPRLFGGGEAKLVMTGEEILDAGIEVRAQPPGKRNSTIHLLSGGEKALTAIALIFALFQLNPAPFCLLDEVDAPLDDTNTERFCNLVRQMSEQTQFMFISHNKITMEIAAQLVGVTMPEQGVSRVVAVDIEEALRLKEAAAA
ncbi:MAG TPA: chromosome segregation protein SMC [Burkholderiales bacterium]|nr:chromosome segregation protein SMC [Burkholderiales bacterium]